MRFIVRWKKRRIKKLRALRRVIRVRRTTLAGSTGHYHQHRTAAMAFVAKQLPELNRAYGFTYHRVTIRNQATRWGSCSKQGNLNFHYKIVLLPPALADYILVHELCHLQELNHSRAFWDLVTKTTPNYRALKKQLLHFQVPTNRNHTTTDR